MKGLRKVLTPFAPDQSGAVSVLYELGGIVVICDAGGCAGNVCGFDEPRWSTQKSAVFSAGLRDMDAILGRDDRLVSKLSDAARKLDADFAAIVGTPVPAVIATDYHALKRMAERKTKLPILSIDTNGMELSDVGAEKAYLELVRTFVMDALPVEKGRIGVWGVNPLDASDLNAGDKLRERLAAEGWSKVDCYGMGAGLDRIRTASAAELNLVTAPSGLKAAQELERRFGTPYRIFDPLSADILHDTDYSDKNILIVHHQVTANTLRTLLLDGGAASVTVADWFTFRRELAQSGDVRLKEEDQFEELVREGGFDLIIADSALKPLARDFSGEWLDAPHFALSGRLLP